MRVLLALPLVLTTACGDNLSGPDDPEGNDGLDPSGAVDGVPTAARYVPQVCDAQSFPSVQLEAKDTAIRVVPYHGGDAVFMVPESGGTLRGVLVDFRGNVIGDPAGVKIRSDASFTSLSASRVDERFIFAAVSGDRTYITAVRDDLGDFRALAVADGGLVSESTVMHMRGTRVTMTGGAKGVVATTFDSEWGTRGSAVVSTSIPTSIASAQYGTEAIVAWSSDAECHVMGVSSKVGSMRPSACQNARLAVDFAARGGWMVYERDAGIMITRIDAGHPNVMANDRLLVARGSSPRIAFDGKTFWASYVDAHGDVTVGMLDETGQLSAAVVEGTAPSGNGYDLTVAQGSATIFAVDRTGLAATRLCKTLAP